MLRIVTFKVLYNKRVTLNNKEIHSKIREALGETLIYGLHQAVDLAFFSSQKLVDRVLSYASQDIIDGFDKLNSISAKLIPLTPAPSNLVSMVKKYFQRLIRIFLTLLGFQESLNCEESIDRLKNSIKDSPIKKIIKDPEIIHRIENSQHFQAIEQPNVFEEILSEMENREVYTHHADHYLNDLLRITSTFFHTPLGAQRLNRRWTFFPLYHAVTPPLQTVAYFWLSPQSCLIDQAINLLSAPTHHPAIRTALSSLSLIARILLL